MRAEDDKGLGYLNLIILIRFEKPFDFMPFVIIGAIVSLVIIGVVVAYIKIPSWIFARRDRRVQDLTVESKFLNSFLYFFYKFKRNFKNFFSMTFK